MKPKITAVILMILSIAVLLASCAETKQTVIKFDSDGGSEVRDILLTEGVLSAMPETPVKAGYSFEGWYYDRECLYICDFNEPEKIKQKPEITLYAKWSLIYYPVSYRLDGGSFVQALLVDDKYTVKSQFVLPLASNLRKPGHTFLGWSDGQQNVTAIPAGSTGEKSFTALWAINSYDFTVTTDTGSGTVSGAADGRVVYGTSMTLTATANAGYSFDGWYEGETKVSSQTVYTCAMPDRDYHLTAKWKAK